MPRPSVEEPRGKLEVISRGPHRDRHRGAIDPNFQRFFDREVIGDPRFASVVPLENVGRLDALKVDVAWLVS